MIEFMIRQLYACFQNCINHQNEMTIKFNIFAEKLHNFHDNITHTNLNLYTKTEG